MKKFILILIFLCNITSISYTGTIRRVEDFWDIRVYKTKIKQEADIIVYKANKLEDVLQNDAMWKKDPYGETAIKYTSYIDEANLVVYFTDNPQEARWKRKHPLKGQIRN